MTISLILSPSSNSEGWVISSIEFNSFCLIPYIWFKKSTQYAQDESIKSNVKNKEKKSYKSLLTIQYLCYGFPSLNIYTFNCILNIIIKFEKELRSSREPSAACTVDPLRRTSNLFCTHLLSEFKLIQILDPPLLITNFIARKLSVIRMAYFLSVS